ncbi:MAG: hypothetical protein V2J55_13150 [Candidatus Competibacteraceae bacterium]|jgi:hypothetical protein|nr:hypothetical protein [Candidatus Competibacteraceae bacterium]
MVLRVRPAVRQDAAALASCLRQADLREIMAATTEQPLLILEHGVAWSAPCLAVTDEFDRPVALFGVVPDPVNSDIGRIWLLAAETLVAHPYAFLRHSREWINKLLDRYRVLWNTIDARNDVHIRWLEWCGFRIIATLDKHGPEQRTFYEFEITR